MGNPVITMWTICFSDNSVCLNMTSCVIPVPLTLRGVSFSSAVVVFLSAFIKNFFQAYYRSVKEYGSRGRPFVRYELLEKVS